MLLLLLFSTTQFHAAIAAAAAVMALWLHFMSRLNSILCRLLASGVNVCHVSSCHTCTTQMYVRRVEQGKLEGSALYAQQQAANAAAAATCIQAVWRGRQARRSTASLRVVLQQQRQRDRAATAIQVCHVGDKLCFS